MQAGFFAGDIVEIADGKNPVTTGSSVQQLLDRLNRSSSSTPL